MEISAIAVSGLNAAQNQVERVAGRIARATIPETSSGDTVDLAAEMVALMEGRNQFQANVKSAQTADEMERSALDIVA